MHNDLFFNLMREIKKDELGIGSKTRISDAKGKLISIIKTLSQPDLNYFYDYHYNEICQLCLAEHGDLLKYFENLYACGIARVFEKFIKGITVFKDQQRQDQELERCIYNEMCKKTPTIPFDSQDIQVSIKYDKQWPTSVTIIRSGEIEEYYRDVFVGATGFKYYCKLICCKLTDSKGNTKAKVQEFSRCSRWVQVSQCAN